MSWRLRALAEAQSQLGVQETPPGSNRGVEVSKWLLNAKASPGEPWCAAFSYSMFTATGNGHRPPVEYPAAVASWVDAGERHGWLEPRPYRGDLVAFSWHGQTPHPDDHMGFVERVLALPWPRNRRRFWLRTVEGNTADAVRRRWRWVDPRTVRFLRVPG